MTKQTLAITTMLAAAGIAYSQLGAPVRPGDPLPGLTPTETALFDAGIPVFGICRGLQFLNVHRGGSLLQHVDGQVGAAYPATPALSHPLDVQGGTKLAQILGDGHKILIAHRMTVGIID